MKNSSDYVIVASDRLGFFYWHACGDDNLEERANTLHKFGAKIYKILRGSEKEAKEWISTVGKEYMH